MPASSIKSVNPIRCGKSEQYLNREFRYVVLSNMADEKEKKGSKDVILWIITVALIALAIFLYKK